METIVVEAGVVAGVLAAAGMGGAPDAVSQELAMWSALAGWFTPLVVAVIQQRRWAPEVRVAATIAVCVCVAAVTCVLEGTLTADRWVSSALTVATLAVVTYQTVWKKVADRVEGATSPGRHRAPEGGR
ncbi:hypothetical protein [Actinoplanes sp. NBRC 101535]|uniref:hypothetical protein n=1 Tax=Actinoplanes sp. NBRC 101535 TaxID=3032196 RepID=UPI0025543128|nr:hypothetical protein [Actinoplanes sp. NBRC 101535]